VNEAQPQFEDLRGKLTAQQFDLAVRGLELPTFPCVLRKVLSADPSVLGREACLDRLIEIISCDMTLSARVLAEAHRRFGAVTTILRASRDLGLESLRTLALSTRLLPPGDQEPASGLDHVGLWRHSLGVALAGRRLAAMLSGQVDPELAYAGGLLHDVGKLALDQAMPKSYRRVLEAVRLHVSNIADFERRIIGIDHGMAGRRLAQRWCLGAAIEQSAWLCHNLTRLAPDSLGELRLLVEVVGLADTITRLRGIGFSGNFAFPQTLQQQADRLGLSPDQVEQVGRELEAQVRAAQELLGLDEAVWPAADETLRLANLELARMSGELGRQVEELSGPAEAFARLGGLVAAMAEQAAVDQALVRLAGAVADVLGGLGSGESLVVYAVAPQGQGVLAMHHRPGSMPQWRQLPATAAAAAPADPADSIIEFSRRLLGDLADLTDWVDLTACLHRALVSGGRWVGGIVYPSRCGQSGRVRRTLEAMEGPLGGMLAEIQARSQSARLGEELAAAAQTLASAQEALAEARVLAAVGEMAAGAAHEMNNPLAVISGRAQLMRERAGDEEAKRTWQLVADQAQRISDIITDLMEYASPPQPRKAMVDVKDLLHQAAAEFSSATDVQAGASRVDISTAEDAPPVLADPAQVRAVLVELMRNAASAAGQAAPSIHLSARMDEADGNVLIIVRDEGCGMDAQTLAAAFAPFFSSQRAGRRRGLGLPKAKRFVEINGGRIWIRSQVAQGSTVYVELPRAGEQAVQAAAGRDKQARELRPGGRNERPSVQQQQAADEPRSPRPGSG